MVGRVAAHVRQQYAGFLALFIALGGVSYAAVTLPRNSVGSRQIAPGAIKASELGKNAVNSSKVKNGSLQSQDFATGAITGSSTTPGPQGPQGPQGPAGPAGPQGGQGAAGQDATAPKGAVMYFNLASCPSGWSELVAAQGRYLVGVPAGGTLGGSSGTPLGNQEDRTVGRHTHTIFGAHDHSIPAVGGSSGNQRGLLYGTGNLFTAAYGTYTDGYSIVAANAGSVAGTNAPYLQLRVCQKD